MRIRCKECGTILLSTKTGENNCIIESDYEIDFDDRWQIVLKEVGKSIVCTNCGHRIPFSKLKELGVPVEVLE